MEKVKLSDIRAKFPMYADLSDDDLLIGLRRKYYSDIPLRQFLSRIEYDSQRDKLDQEVAGDTNTVLAGIGQGMTNVARGIGQAVGLVSRDDIKESRATDRALNATTGGKVGNVLGTVAPLALTSLVPGAGTFGGAAAIGALTGAFAPSESTEETIRNTALGGVLGPAGNVAVRAGGAALSGARALAETFTKKGQERIAARTLQQFASDPDKARKALKAARPLVPGSLPTMAQASGDEGLAQLERTLVNNPESGRVLAGRFADQRAARLSAVQDVAGTDEYYNAIKAGVKTFADEDYGKAMAQGFDREMAAALKPQIKALMERPSMQQAVATAKQLAKEKNITLKNPGGSIEGLDWMKKALDNEISRAMAPGSSIGKEKLGALVQTKKDLMDVIEQIAPAYKEANDNFAKMSRQVNAMDAAREVLDKMQPALGRYGANTRELKNEYARALESATESVKKTTGQNKPLAAVMPFRDVATLENVARDMARAARADDAGRAFGSNTAQNLAAQNLLRRTLGPAGLPQSWAESNALQAFLTPYTGVSKLAGSEQAVLNRLIEAAANPQDAALLLALGVGGRPPISNALLRYAPAMSLPYAQQQ